MRDWAFALMWCVFFICVTLVIWHGCQNDHEATIKCLDKGGYAYTGSYCHFKDRDKDRDKSSEQ